GEDVLFIPLLVVHINNSTPDLNDVSGHANHSLDIGLCWIEGIPKNNNIFPLNLFDPVDEFVDEDSFLVDQFRQHARAFDLNRLVEKDRSEERRVGKVWWSDEQ